MRSMRSDPALIATYEIWGLALPNLPGTFVICQPASFTHIAFCHGVLHVFRGNSR